MACGIATDVTQLTQLRQHFQKLCLHDCLTGVYTRNYVVEYDFDSEENLPCSYIMCDCNDLKKINDQQGHAKGDEYICQTAELLRHACPPKSVLVRWGGDEFLIITPNCSKQEHIQLLQHIRQEQETLQTLYPYLNVAVGGAVRYSVSTSEQSIIQQADRSMYLDKAKCKACHSIHLS